MKIYLAEIHKEKIINNISNIFNKNNNKNIYEEKYILILTKESLYKLTNNEISELIPIDKNSFKIDNFYNGIVYCDNSYFEKKNNITHIPLEYKSIKVHKYIYPKYFNYKNENKTVKKTIELIVEFNKINSKTNTICYLNLKHLDINCNDDKNLLSNFLNNIF